MSDQAVIAERMSADTIRRHHDAAKQKLKERYPKLDEAWEAAEKEFARYHLPQEVWLTCREKIIDDDCTLRVCLSVQRSNKTAHISVAESWLEAEPDFVKSWRITQAPVCYRVELVEYLPALREAVVKSAEEFIPKVDEAIQTLGSFLTK